MTMHPKAFAFLLAIAALAAEQVAPVTLMRPTTPDKAPAADGFIQRWLVLEPIPANGLTDSAVQALVKKEYFPKQFTVIPHDGDKVTVGDTQLTWHAGDTRLYNLNLYHFAHALDRPTTNVLFWAVTLVNCPREMPGVVSWVTGPE